MTPVLLIVVGVVAIADGVRALRRRSRDHRHFDDAVARPFRALAAIHAGITFVVVGILVALGVLDLS